ncbi:MAG TPA: Mur ligase family protein [Trebonia sp.]
MTIERPGLGWSDLRDRNVGVWGFGREGSANLRKLRSMDIEPVLVDDDPPDDAENVLRTDSGGLEALLKCDVVVKTPGISRYRPEAGQLRDAGVSLTGGLGLWLAEADIERVIVVTGTKGKSTTSSVIGHLLNGLGQRAAIGGNIGNVPWDPHSLGGNDPPQAPPAHGGVARPPVPPAGSPHGAPDTPVRETYGPPGGPVGAPPGGLGGGESPNRRGGVGGIVPPRKYWVIEVSSYQATDLARTPPVAAVTSLHPDHLPWHGGVDQYYRDKLSALSQPGADLTVANGDSDLIRERRRLLGPRVEWVREDDDPDATWMEPLGLPGGHNRRNALIARAVLRALRIPGAEDDARLRAAAEGYEGLPSRLKEIGTVAGVRFVDDSLSTNVLPTLAALDAFPGQRVALIVGGQDRGIDYRELAEGVGRRESPISVLTLPDSGPRISRAFETTAPETTVTDCPDLATAVRAGFEWARPDGIVLLSPAAPSFGHFRDYRDRAAAFAREMGELDAAFPPPG